MSARTADAGAERSRVVTALLFLIGLLALLAVATVPLEPREQALFAVGTLLLFLLLNRSRRPMATLILIALSLTVSCRYLVWRIIDTMPDETWAERLLGGGLVLAEMYAIGVLVLGYLQTAAPLHRKPIPLPQDPALWPMVDVFIPTYTEPLSIVRTTVLAALAMDWPADRLRVHILDDGRREEFRDFAEQVGCLYLTRDDNRHAKAGNLNAALARTEAEFVAIFDCDHIPTRAFLQLTLGWLVHDPKLALVQTPQHFYSPDPFQRNLAAGRRVPAEGNLFHGLLQDGNDFWNAAFFTGSCAVIRRAALASIGGFAPETVTEDAHTTLRLHRAGWDSAYLNLPLAAGLATERLGRHIAQRRRWARGMLQILRLDPPLFGPGLTIAQRLCYLQATAHFLFALPRLVFLTAPLAFLLLGQSVIAASPLAITAYALPHLFHSLATGARLHGSWRHSFWSSIHETVLAPFLLRVIAATLLAPRRARFHVTAKGGPLDHGYLDLRAVYPNLILAGLLTAGIARALVSLLLLRPDGLTLQALALNAVWAGCSLVVVLGAIAVGRETRQGRSHASVAADMPVTVALPDGRMIGATTLELSREGGLLQARRPDALFEPQFEPGELDVAFRLSDEVLPLPARVVRWEEGRLDVRWQPITLEQEARVVRAVFGRADAWLNWSNFERDRPLLSLWRVLQSVGGLFRPRDREQPADGGPSSGAAAPSADRAIAPGVATAAGVLAALMLASVSAAAQTSQGRPAAPGRTPSTGMTVRVIPQPITPLALPAPPSAPPAAPPAAPPIAPVPPPSVAAPAPITPPVAEMTRRAGTRQVIYNLRQLGAAGPLALRGASPSQGVEFGIRADEVVIAAQLSLSGATSPSLIPELSNVTVTLNEQYVGTIPVRREQPSFQIELPVGPGLFQDTNRLGFRLAGRYANECNDPLSGLLWATVNDTSTLTLTLERLPPQRDLARLPQPFFDGLQKDMLTLPFVIGGNPGNDALRAAGIAASWFGQLAAFRGASFPVLSEPPAEGNAVMIVVGGEGHGVAGLPPINGPTLAVLANPNDRQTSLLVIAGRNGEEAVSAAAALALGGRTLGGDLAVVQAPQAAPRRPYDAPAWIPTDRAVKLGELVDAGGLQSSGYVGLLHVPFRTAPDFYTWRNRPFDLTLKYRAPAAPIIDLGPSRLDVGINGVYLGTLPLAAPGTGSLWLARLLSPGDGRAGAHVAVPAYDVSGDNDLQLFFDARPLRRGDCGAVPQDLRMSVDPDSTIDLSRGHRFTQMPNLAFFVNSGFPFTRMADLSETGVVLPDRPSSAEIGTFLNLMGRFGALTGAAAVHVMVVRPDGLDAIADRDILLLGTLSRLQGAAGLLRDSAVQLNGGRVSLAVSDMLDPVRRFFDVPGARERERAAATLSGGLPETTAVLVGGESPRHAGRSVVALLAAAPQALDGLAASLRDPTLGPLIQGDLSMVGGGHVASYRVTAPYTVGSLPFWLWPGWYLRDQPAGLLALTLVGCAALAVALRRMLLRRATRHRQPMPTGS